MALAKVGPMFTKKLITFVTDGYFISCKRTIRQFKCVLNLSFLNFVNNTFKNVQYFRVLFSFSNESKNERNMPTGRNRIDIYIYIYNIYIYMKSLLLLISGLYVGR